MELIHSRCCGVDVHKKSITACVLLAEDKTRQKYLRHFGAMTADLRGCAAWVQSFAMVHIATGTTGVY